MQKNEFLRVQDFCEYYELSRREFQGIIKPIANKLVRKGSQKFMPFEVAIIKKWIEKGEK